MSFAAPAWGWLALALLLFAVWRARDRRAWLDVVAALLLIVTLARPQRNSTTLPREIPPPCVAVVDLSRSMLARDVAPNRFAAAVARLTERIGAEPGRRFGVVAFAGDAWRVAPPTADSEALRELLAELDPQRVDRPGSDPAAGIALALELIADARGSELFVLSDGEWDGGEVEPLLERARAAGVRVTASAVGTPTAAPIPADAMAGEQEREAELTTARPERVAALGEASVAPPAAPPPPLFGLVTWCALAAFVAALVSHWLGGREP